MCRINTATVIEFLANKLWYEARPKLSGASLGVPGEIYPTFVTNRQVPTRPRGGSYPKESNLVVEDVHRVSRASASWAEPLGVRSEPHQASNEVGGTMWFLTTHPSVPALVSCNLHHSATLLPCLPSLTQTGFGRSKQRKWSPL